MSRLSYSIGQSLMGLFVTVQTMLTIALPGLALKYNPPNRGAPANTRDAGSRNGGTCGNLTAVQPSQTNWGETLMGHPTFGIYVSEPVTNLMFELRDERSQAILHTATFAQVNGPGISLYTLPDSAPALEPNHYYRWRVSLECEQFNTAHIQYTDTREAGGMIMRRVASDELQANLATTTDTDTPALLAANGLWYDMIQALLTKQSADTEQWTDAWQTLLVHPMVNLNNLMEATLIECCLVSE